MFSSVSCSWREFRFELIYFGGIRVAGNGVGSDVVCTVSIKAEAGKLGFCSFTFHFV